MIIGIDAGGTNIDGVLVSRKGMIDSVKVPRDSNELASIEKVLRLLVGRNELNPESINRIVIGTTLILNAALEGKLERCGCILIPGPGLHPSLACAGERNFISEGYIDHRGRKVEDLRPEKIKRFMEENEDLKCFAVVGKFSTRNPELELEAADLIGDRIVSMGHRVAPELGFPRRASATVFNAKSIPIFSSFIEELEHTMNKMGISAPVYFVKSDSAMINTQTAREIPSVTVKSGPAMSTLGLLALTGVNEGVAVDIGGTTTDVGLIINGELKIREKIDLAGYRTFISSIDSIDIPLGGDSPVYIKNGEIVIRRCREGPAAAFGGEKATVTDALHVTGLFTDGDFTKARQAIQQIDFSQTPELLSEKIIDTFCSQIVQEMLEFLDERGIREIPPLLGGGVLSPYLLPVIAEKIGAQYIIPKFPEVAGAVGCAVARVNILTSIHLDTALGVMTVNGEIRSAEKGVVYSRNDLIRLAEREVLSIVERSGSSCDARDVVIRSLRCFNVVKWGRVVGQIGDIEAQLRPGISPDVDLRSLRCRK